VSQLCLPVVRCLDADDGSDEYQTRNNHVRQRQLIGRQFAPRTTGKPECKFVADGMSIILKGRPTRLKWHRLRRSMRDPEFGTAVMTSGFALGASTELDHRVRADGGFVVLHDEALDRETTGAGRVADWRGDALRAITFRQSGDVLILSETLEAIMPSAQPDAQMQFDMKDDLDPVGLRGIEHLADHFGRSSCPIIFSGKSTDLIRALAERLPGVRRGIDPTNRLVAAGLDRGTTAVEATLIAELRDGTEPDTCYLAWDLLLQCQRRGLDLVALCHAERVRVDAWTCNLSDPAGGFMDAEWEVFLLLMTLRPDQITTDESRATEEAWLARAEVKHE
jgi:glycerophosphoryl diester phosphodiesterase